MPSPQLPPELLYDIINHLGAEEDYASLRACALTCRAFVSPTQAHIFRTLTLFRDSPAWLAKLESTPHIRTFIKHLRLVEYHKPWIQRSEVLNRMLGYLSSYVIFLDIHHQRRKLESTRFDFPLLSRLKCVEEISLTERDPEGQGGTMDGDNALPRFLNHFPNLRGITFDGCWVWVQGADSKNDIAAPVFQLERLHVYACYDALVLDWLVPALSSLKTLHLQYMDPDIPIFSPTALPQLESLEHVEVRSLNYASNEELRSLMAAVAHSVNLRSITFMTSGSSSGHSPVEAAVKSLLFLGAHRHLQHLTIGFFQEDDPVDGSPWDELQDLLLGGRFPALRTVKLLFWLDSSGSNAASTEPFVVAVPRLAKKNMVYACYGR
ncbi:hypothetical protein NLJ89_g7029 [Agrocybe chaxingu]|uniref:F-box domain-containing protein n=1 Tax=Agrocybe chaxingu TaxID=84603 RepID=A0A9W8JXL6_9AGAR|nr:hypothetical protein NLJ89_g7029 [Agrocybe chaxingu]